MERILQAVGAKKVLDVGCGVGRITLPLANRGYEMTGLDGSKAFLDRAHEKIVAGKIDFKQADILEYHEAVSAESYDAVLYTWHTFLEAYGMGNTLATLNHAWRALKPGGTLVFDQPTRENTGMEDGWYGDVQQERPHYLSYLMAEDELRFVLRMAGFEDVDITPWTSRPSDLYPEGMKKWTITAKKPKK